MERKKMTKKQMTRCARLIVASVIIDLWSTGASPEQLGMAEDEFEFINANINEIGYRILRDNPVLGSTQDCIDHVLANKKR